MKHPKNPPPRAALTIVFSIVVFCIISVTMIIVGSALYVLVQLGVVGEMGTPNILLPLIIFTLVSIVTGTMVAALTSSVPLKPMNRLIHAMNRLASGDYSTRLKLGRHPLGKEISDSFNLLADELQNTEVLRSDFVNNFSHEFKTPIVSIRGFAKLLKKDALTDKQKEYLDIIIDESSRLSVMATNVLNLSKVENQSILTDITRFNLSEQLRDCILLLEKKWMQKGLNLNIDFDECYIDANEEMLKQVWINLIDNSIKFSNEFGEIGVAITKTSDKTIVSIKNNGPEIGEEEKKRIFNKYWQGDTSHASEGTGIGLSVARRIVDLHKGDISVNSSSKETIFVVELP